MTGTLHPWGYGAWARRLTLAEMAERPDVAKLNPVFRDRLFAMMTAAAAEGVDLGIGGGARSSAQQERTFRARYVAHPSPPGIRWADAWWRKRPGVASAAPPGRSYHEDDMPGGALAADMIGNLEWMNANCDRFGLRHFRNVNREPWHVQPVEVPTSRSNYNGEPLVIEHTHWLYGAQVLTDTRPLDLPVTEDRPRTVILPTGLAAAELRVTAIGTGGSGNLRLTVPGVGADRVDAVANYDAPDRIDATNVTVDATHGRVIIHAYGAPAHVKVTLWATTPAA